VALAHLFDQRGEILPGFTYTQEKAVSLGMPLMFPSDDAEIAERNRKLSEGTIDL